MLRRFWLLFAQACTLCVAALFVVSTLRPDLLPRLSGPRSGTVVLTQEAVPAAAAGQAGAAAAGTHGSLSAAARKALPAVVNIYTSKEIRARHPLFDDQRLRQMFPELAAQLPPQRANSLGSGVIVSADGYVLTNHHVVAGADDIELLLADGRALKARLTGSDPESDVAVLKAEATGLPSITFGALDTVQIGDPVLAIGNAFGLRHTVTSGIVSALGRSSLGINRFEDFIQTDAAINPGNSGGALVDASGNLIGINSAIFSQSGGSMGIGFAIPVTLARSVLEQIIRDGEVTRGWLGVDILDDRAAVARALAQQRTEGVVIRGVQPGSPADRAGVRDADVVVEVAGKPVKDTPALLARIAELKPGTTARVVVVRDTRPVALDVVVGRRPRAS
ncbi:MAG: trypsin-like peptidase domain-containing protein [Burkholderiales bacterium]|nr:trypsin-like peptidase domain-containing protein [Burkholderiales bacterium]